MMIKVYDQIVLLLIFGTTDKSDEFDFTADDLDKMYIGNADLDKLLLDAEEYLEPDLVKKYFLAGR